MMRIFFGKRLGGGKYIGSSAKAQDVLVGYAISLVLFIAVISAILKFFLEHWVLFVVSAIALIALGFLFSYTKYQANRKQWSGAEKNKLLERSSSCIPKEKEFKFLILDDYESPPKNVWFRRASWKDAYYLRMDTVWSKDWKNYSANEPIVTLSQQDSARKFIILADQKDFNIFLDRESTNPYNENAIKVMGKATVDDVTVTYHLGYLSGETAEALKEEQELDARPYSVYFSTLKINTGPFENFPYDLKIRVLVRSKAYKKR